MSAENDFKPGLAIEGLASITLAQLITFLSAATPDDNKGIIIWDTATPDVASNPRFARYLWWDVTNSLLKRYNGSSWVAVGSTNVTSASQVSDGIIPIAKLLQSEGSVGNILRKNPGTGTIEWAALASILSAGVVPLSAISTSGSTEGAYMRFSSGLLTYVSSAAVAAEILSAITSIDPAKLSGRSASSVLAVDSANTISFQSFATFLGNLATGSIPLAKLDVTAATTGQVLTISGGVPVWASLPIVTTGTIAIPSKNTITTLAAGLASKPRFLRLVLQNQTANLNYVPGDEVDLDVVAKYANGRAFYVLIVKNGAVYDLKIDWQDDGGGANKLFVPDASTASTATEIDNTKWLIKAYYQL